MDRSDLNPPNDKWPVRHFQDIRTGAWVYDHGSWDPSWELIIHWLTIADDDDVVLVDIQTFWSLDEDGFWHLLVTAIPESIDRSDEL